MISKSKCTGIWVSLLFQLILSGWAYGQDGIASHYLNDAGIDKDPNVIFAEDFEDTDIADYISPKRWVGNYNPGQYRFTSDKPAASPGKQSISASATVTVDMHHVLDTGYQQLYFRYYLKYSDGTQYHHTGTYIRSGANPGQSGIKPPGTYFGCAIEARTSGLKLGTYAKWMGMHASGDGKYWGDNFIGSTIVPIDPPKWICVEIMMKLNNPLTSTNGEFQMWIDGKEIAHLGPGYPKGRWAGDIYLLDTTAGTAFPGFQWRDNTATKILRFGLQYYQCDPNHPCWPGKIYYDDLVIAKSYIGPINTPVGIASATLVPQAAQDLFVETLPGKVPVFRTITGESGKFLLQVRDIAGRTVWCYNQTAVKGGEYMASWENARNGLYFIELKQNGKKKVRKFTVMQ